MRTGVLGVIALGLLTAACGTTQEQRAATGGLTGAGVGALVGGPIGAAVGLAAGAVGGTLMPEDATAIANNALGREHRAANNLLNSPSATATTEGSGTSVHAAAVPQGLVKEAQTRLQQQGLYKGQIDGIAGPQTRHAILAFQKRENLRQTARLDRETARRLNAEGNAAQAPVNAQPPAASGSSTPNNAAAPAYDNSAPQTASPASPATAPNTQPPQH